MEHKFAAFVAYASLVAQQELAELLRKHRINPTVDVLTDAGRFGIRKAFERFFPGLLKLPFQNDPLPQVVLGLRYLYEADPEGMGSANAPEVTGAGVSGRYRVAPSSNLRPTGPSDTSQRLSGAVPRPAGPSDTSQRLSGVVPTNLNQRSPSSTQVPKLGTGSGTGNSNFPGFETPRPTPLNGEESSQGGVSSGTGTGPGKLRKIGPAPVFPWEKRRPGGGNQGGGPGGNQTP